MRESKPDIVALVFVAEPPNIPRENGNSSGRASHGRTEAPPNQVKCVKEGWDKEQAQNKT